MSEQLYGLPRVHGKAGPARGIVPSLTYVKINTLVPLDFTNQFGSTPPVSTTAGYTEADAAENALILSNRVGLCAVQVNTNLSYAVVDLSNAGVAASYGFGSTFTSAGTTVYTYTLMLERPFVYGGSSQDVANGKTAILASDPSNPLSLAAVIDGTPTAFGSFPTFNLSSATVKNTVVALIDTLG